MTKRIADLAVRRHGVVTTADLIAAGLGRGAIARRVADGRLRPLHRGVFLVGPLKGPRTDEMAAVLACGPTAVVSHHAAAAMWGFRPAWHGPIDVTTTRQLRPRQGIRIHRARHIGPHDVTRRDGVPLTTPSRTLLDLAAHIDARTLARAIEEAEIQHLTTRPELAALSARSSGRHGAKALAATIESAYEPAMTRSQAEAELLRLIRAAGLPQPETNVRIAGYEVDFLWRAERLARGLRTTRVTFRPRSNRNHTRS